MRRAGVGVSVHSLIVLHLERVQGLLAGQPGWDGARELHAWRCRDARCSDECMAMQDADGVLGGRGTGQ